MTTPWKRLVALFAAMGLVLAACGDSDETEAGSGDTPAAAPCAQRLKMGRSELGCAGENDAKV